MRQVTATDPRNAPCRLDIFDAGIFTSDGSNEAAWAALVSAPVGLSRNYVSVTRRSAHSVEARQILVAQHDVERADVLLEIATTLRPRYGRHVVTLCVHPGERHLGRSRALGVSQCVDDLDDGDIDAEVVTLEAGLEAAEVVLIELVSERTVPVRKPRPSGL